MSLKYVALVAVAGAAIWAVAGHETSAQDCTGRTVPVTVCNPTQMCPELAPSRMVAASGYFDSSAAQPVQISLALPAGKVFVLTSWSAAPDSGGTGVVKLVEGPTYSHAAVREVGHVYNTQMPSGVHHTLPTGIRFPRDANGNADLYVKIAVAATAFVSVQGYVADDI